MISEYLLYAVVILFSITLHEVAHAYVAYLRGDDTAKMSGRITLNPISHIELFGSIILPVMLLLMKAPIFAWAKPVPIDYRKLKNPKLDILLVSLAGPASNLSLAFFSGLVICLVGAFPNFTASFSVSIEHCFSMMIKVNARLLIINMIPIPPLDGSKIMAYFLPVELRTKYLNLNPYIGFIILNLVLLSGMTNGIINLIINFFVMIFTS